MLQNNQDTEIPIKQLDSPELDDSVEPEIHVTVGEHIENQEINKQDDGPMSASKKKRLKKKNVVTTKATENQPTQKPKVEAASKAKPNVAVERIKKMMEIKKQEEEQRRKEQEALQKAIKDEEDRIKEEERLAEERRRQRSEQKKERLKKLKAEGRPVTKAQRENQARFQIMIEAMKSQGINMPFEQNDFDKNNKASNAPKKTFIYDKKKRSNVKKSDPSNSQILPNTFVDISDVNANKLSELVSSEVSINNKTSNSNKTEAVPDNWEDALLTDEELSEDTDKELSNDTDKELNEDIDGDKTNLLKRNNFDKKNFSTSINQEVKVIDGLENTLNSIQLNDSPDVLSKNFLDSNVLYQDKLVNNNDVSIKNDTTTKKTLRSPIICVLGHVDTGKTKILDKLRLTNVQANEAGGITQQIGVTNVAFSNIRHKIKDLSYMSDFKPKIPGILIIDTPGHESFRNLRLRGSSLCDFAILVVDIMHGLEPQTIESLKLLTQKKAPFVVALNKVDRLYGWKSNPTKSIIETLKEQSQVVKNEFEDRYKFTTLKFAEQGFNISLFNQDVDFNVFIPVIPTSAHSGDGINDLIGFICKQSQTFLRKRLTKKLDKFEAIVMEVKMVPGMGSIVDVILINGKLKEGDTVVFSRFDEPIVTQVKAILTSKPMTDLRASKTNFYRHNEISESQGIRIFASGETDKVVAGTPMLLKTNSSDLDQLIQEAHNNVSSILDNFHIEDSGVYVQASTLGSLEALLDFLHESKIPYSGINIGPVHKKDVVKASVMLESNPLYAVILAFDVRVDSEIMQFAHKEGVKIFTADIIYHLFDSFMAYTKEYKHKEKDKFRSEAIFPCKLRILPEHVYRKRAPIVIGVNVEAGFVVIGTPLCIPTKDNLLVGVVVSIRLNDKEIEKAVVGQEVSIKIEPLPNTQILDYDNHFNYTHQLVSKITRSSIDILKNYFTDEMKKADWQLIIELKKTFDII